MIYKVVKGLKYYRVEGTDIEDKDLYRLAQQMAEDREIEAAYHADEIDISKLQPEKKEELEYFLRVIITGAEINESCFSGEEEFFPVIPLDRELMKAEFH